jgi:hypothetical protein
MILTKYNMPCHEMHPKEDYLRKDFYMHLTWTSILAKFYHCKKECYKPTPLKGISPSRFRKCSDIIWDNLV